MHGGPLKWLDPKINESVLRWTTWHTYRILEHAAVVVVQPAGLQTIFGVQDVNEKETAMLTVDIAGGRRPLETIVEGRREKKRL